MAYQFPGATRAGRLPGIVTDPDEPPPVQHGRRFGRRRGAGRVHVTRNRPDYVLLALVGVLITVGLEAVFSSSFVFALDAYNDVSYFVARQAMWVSLGGLALLVTMRIDYHFWSRVSGWLMAATVIMLVCVLIPGLG